MKRLLRVATLGPILLVAAAAFVAVYPIVRFIYWITDDTWPSGTYQEIHRDIWREIWG